MFLGVYDSDASVVGKSSVPFSSCYHGVFTVWLLGVGRFVGLSGQVRIHVITQIGFNHAWRVDMLTR